MKALINKHIILVFLHKNIILVHYRKSLIICTKGIHGRVPINTLNQPLIHTHSSQLTSIDQLLISIRLTLDQHSIDAQLTLDWYSVEYTQSKEPSFYGHQNILTRKYEVLSFQCPYCEHLAIKFFTDPVAFLQGFPVSFA